MESIKVPQLKETATVRVWYQMPLGTIFKNIGFNAEVGYGATEPLTLQGEPLLQGEEARRSDMWVLQDTYSSYSFVEVAI